MPDHKTQRLRAWLAVAHHLRGHVFILTSGSSAASELGSKWVALAKPAVLASATASNRHLDATKSDRWLHCLPDFHVGGLGIWARAGLSGASVVRMIDERWSAQAYVSSIASTEATLSSLVPAQVFDLVKAGLTCPSSMRAIVVGGSALSPEVYFSARELGWPVLPSYGLSEAASQVATANLASLNSSTFPDFEVLRHIEVAVDSNGYFKVRGASLLTGYIKLDDLGCPHLFDPKDQGGWFTTEDFGEVTSLGLRVGGRRSDRIKIGGELANLGDLRATMDRVAAAIGCGPHVVLVAEPDVRLESTIALVAERAVDTNTINLIREAFDSEVLPFERIRKVRIIERIPRSELGKVKWAELSSAGQEQ